MTNDEFAGVVGCVMFGLVLPVCMIVISIAVLVLWGSSR